jgi:hypothetical protein
MSKLPVEKDNENNTVLIGLIILTVIAGLMVTLIAVFAGGMTEG